MAEKTIKTLIRALELEPHPEGGYYRETYRSRELVRRQDNGERSAGTGIYFLLPGEVCTRWHRVNADELWHFYKGAPLVLEVLDADGQFHRKQLYNDVSSEAEFQALVPGSCWQRAYSRGDYSLAGCTVSPGFLFDDFEMTKAGELASIYPQFADEINHNPFE